MWIHLILHSKLAFVPHLRLLHIAVYQIRINSEGNISGSTDFRGLVKATRKKGSCRKCTKKVSESSPIRDEKKNNTNLNCLRAPRIFNSSLLCVCVYAIRSSFSAIFVLPFFDYRFVRCGCACAHIQLWIEFFPCELCVLFLSLYFLNNIKFIWADFFPLTASTHKKKYLKLGNKRSRSESYLCT